MRQQYVNKMQNFCLKALAAPSVHDFACRKQWPACFVLTMVL